jgi:hypothetical protein
MPNAPAGWYLDPDGSDRLRWWSGIEWSTSYAPMPPSTPMATPTPATPTPATGRTGLIVLGLVAAVAGVIGLATSGLGGLLMMVGLVGFGVGVAAVIRGKAPSLRIQSRRGALGAVAAGFAIVSLGGAIAPHVEPAAIESAQVAPAPEASQEPSESASAPPVVVTREQTMTSSIPFAATTVDDPTLAAGTTAITVIGVPGVRTTVWAITYTDGDESERVKVSEEVTTAPVDQVTAVGSYVAPPPPPPAAPAAPSCDPNYSGQCVPIASDVDCAGGSGNGPAYTYGPVAVVGSDIYDLDRDGDGIACD